MRKLPVWSTVLGAYHFVWYGRRPFLTLALPAIAILAILFIMFDAIRATAPDTDEGIGPTAVEPSLNLGVMAVKVVYSLAMPAFWVMFCVAWHRHYLVPGEVATIRTALRWGRRQTRLLLIVIGIGALIVILSLVVRRRLLRRGRCRLARAGASAPPSRGAAPGVRPDGR